MSDQVICQVIDPVVASQCSMASHTAPNAHLPGKVEINDLRLVVR